jgi:hypothetical protein
MFLFVCFLQRQRCCNFVSLFVLAGNGDVCLFVCLF